MIICDDKSECKCLVVDDDLGVRTSISAHLDDCGYTVIPAIDGLDGLNLFRECQPELILLDLRMPRVDGLEVLRQVSNESPHTPVIIISGEGKDVDIITALRLGAWDYIRKPINDLIFLEHVVAKALEHVLVMRENKEYHQYLEDQSRVAEFIKQQFSTILNQDLRLPIDSILDMVHLLEQSDLPSDQADHVEGIKNSTHTIINMITDIWHLSQVEMGSLQLRSEAFDLHEAVKSMQAAVTYGAHNRGLEVAVHIPETVPAVVVGDIQRVQQVLVTLLHNAIKYTQQGDIGIRLKLNSATPLKIYLEVVSSGIEADICQRLEHTIMHLKGMSIPKQDKVGLGFTVAKKLIDFMQGEIGIKSLADDKVSFWVCIPFTDIAH